MPWTTQTPSTATWTPQTAQSQSWSAVATQECRFVTLGQADEQGDGGVDFVLTWNDAAPWCWHNEDTWIVWRDDQTSENP